jgi:uncharacterized damage-inducible protein DinB
MKVAATSLLVVLFTLLGGTVPRAQQGPSSTSRPTLPSVLDAQLSVVEFEVVATAQAMPEDKYSFAPTEGNFKGVRTFAQQVKHIATVNNRLFDSITGQAPPAAPDEGLTSNGPDTIQTKDQILKYLRDSFAYGHKAIATLNADNALTVLNDSPVFFLRTKMSLAMFACTHAMDHYGQMVEYLRMNGIVPPMSAPRPSNGPAPNPPTKPRAE